jgi:2-C-methyl-D-erythritol 4-phosphate cytidylyltransferase
MRVTAIVPAAGQGIRMSGRTKEGLRKPFFVVMDRPILVHTLSALSASSRIDDIIIVVHKDDVDKCKRLVKKYGLKKVVKVVPGGNTRFESVKNGLSHLPKGTEVVVIHDGVRPFVDDKMISDSIDACARFGAAVCGVPVVSTIKSVAGDLTVMSTPDRSKLFLVQTPQVFLRETIEKAYELPLKDMACITDDSMLVERMGHKVKVVDGSYRNIKVTTPEDIILAKALLRET